MIMPTCAQEYKKNEKKEKTQNNGKTETYLKNSDWGNTKRKRILVDGRQRTRTHSERH